jgi:hypothetical protein
MLIRDLIMYQRTGCCEETQRRFLSCATYPVILGRSNREVQMGDTCNTCGGGRKV